MFIKSISVVPLLSFGLCTLSGCGSAGELPELGHVSGTVTFDGQPLRGVEVAFHPVEGRPAFGITNSEGVYTLQYKPETPGCKVGQNRVTIGNAEGDDQDPGVEGDELMQKPGKQRPRIPSRFNEKSELEREVKPGENAFDFALSSSPH